MTTDELKIRDLSRPGTTEWTPPIGAMGGPPAHELYRDLVAHGGLRLLRDEEGNPWVEMQDGERRRAFRVPGVALRGALDRFRMRRNLRPAPEVDLEDFARVVAARVSDPDVRLPMFEGPHPDGSPPETGAADEPPIDGTAPGPSFEEELESVLEDVDTFKLQPPAGPQRPEPPPVWDEEAEEPVVRHRPAEPPDFAISGGWQTGGREDGLPRYLRVLKGLVENGGWLGTLGDLGRLTGEEPDVVFGSLLKYHSEFTGNNLVVAPVEVEDGWRWLVVDRTRLQSSPPPSEEPSDPDSP